MGFLLAESSTGASEFSQARLPSSATAAWSSSASDLRAGVPLSPRLLPLSLARLPAEEKPVRDSPRQCFPSSLRRRTVPAAAWSQTAPFTCPLWLPSPPLAACQPGGSSEASCLDLPSLGGFLCPLSHAGEYAQCAARVPCRPACPLSVRRFLEPAEACGPRRRQGGGPEEGALHLYPGSKRTAAPGLRSLRGKAATTGAAQKGHNCLMVQTWPRAGGWGVQVVPKAPIVPAVPSFGQRVALEFRRALRLHPPVCPFPVPLL